MRYFGKNINLFLNNLMVCYTDDGPDDAPVLIFIHGFPLNKSMWKKQLKALKEQYRVIAYDVRGHGESESTDETTFSIENFAHDLIYFMDALKIDKASLCGLSMGGYIALNAIENYPHRFESLVLCDTSCFPDTPETIEKRMKTVESIEKNGLLNYADNSVKILFAPQSQTTKVAEIAAVKEMILATSIQSLSKTLLALCVRKETCTLLPHIQVPVLIMVGEEDTITPPVTATYMHENIKQSILHVIKHAGHLSNLENSADFNKQLKTFFASVYKDQRTIPSEVITSFVEQLRDKMKSVIALLTI
ncbi:MAG: alpha/beta fold hydrolase [Paludibacter sp.]|nr:alpha/beta fold hydrolase [Paludibacter sp.]